MEVYLVYYEFISIFEEKIVHALHQYQSFDIRINLKDNENFFGSRSMYC
jgi:hypothetical protein